MTIGPCNCPPFVSTLVCGITDDFNRPDDPAGLGIATCGRTWTVQIADPMTIAGDMGSAPGPSVGVRSSSLPGPWPVPFDGRIQITDVNLHPGFTYVAVANVGPAWNVSGAGGRADVDGSQLILEAGLVASGYGNVSAGTKNDRILNDYTAALSRSGHIVLLETHPGTTGKALDEYIELGGPGFSIVNSVAIYGNPPGSPDVALLSVGSGGSEVYAAFPANFWRDVGEADFTVDYTGGLGGVVTVTVGPVTASATLNPTDGLGHGLGFHNASSTPKSPPDLTNDTWATEYVTAALVNGKAITDWNWEWHLDGEDAFFGPLTYRFGFVSMGGRIPFAIPDPWPDTAATPAIYAMITDGTNTVLAITPLVADLGSASTPVVAISATSATLTMGGATATVNNADATPLALGALDSFPSDRSLELELRIGQGDFVLFDNLDVVGVDNCTEGGGGIPGPGPIPNQPVQDELDGVGDGSTFTYATFYPYLAHSLQVQVAGMLAEVDAYDPAGRLYTLVNAAQSGAEVRSTYRASGV